MRVFPILSNIGAIYPEWKSTHAVVDYGKVGRGGTSKGFTLDELEQLRKTGVTILDTETTLNEAEITARRECPDCHRSQGLLERFAKR